MFGLLSTKPVSVANENRIRMEGQKDGEKNIPEMGSYSPAPFEQAIISHGEEKAQKVFGKASGRIAKLQSLYETLHRRFEDIDGRYQRVSQMFQCRKKELDRDVAIPFPSRFHWALIIFLGIGEFPLNTVVFRLFGEPEVLTYIMASTLAITIPLLGLFMGLHMRQSMPRKAGNIIVGLVLPISVGSALFAISLLRTSYVASTSSPDGIVSSPGQMEYILFSLNLLVFFAAFVSSFFAHDPDEKLDVYHSALVFLDRKRNTIRENLFSTSTRLNGEIKKTRSQVEQVRAIINQHVSLYRQTNMRFRQLLPPPTFRRNPDFAQFEWWPEVSVNGFKKQ